MSACKQRHEKRKAERTRRLRSFRIPQSAIRNGAAALAAAAVIAAGTQAYADPVRFDNPAHADPGHFHWVGPLDAENWLDLLAPAESQPGEGGVATDIGQRVSSGGYSKLVSYPGARQAGVAYPDNYFGVGVPLGELIPTAGTSWQVYPTYTFYPDWGPETLLPEGQATYLGVRFDQGSGNQYGWIGVVRTGIELEALAWGYETTPGVPIEAGIPEPGSLALLAFGAVAALRRRRPA